MKKIYLLLLCAIASLGATGQTTIYATGSSGTYTTGNIYGVPNSGGSGASLTRNDGNIVVENYRTAGAGGVQYRGYAVFDLSSIPAGSTITAVTFGWYNSAYTAGTSSGNYYTYGFAGDLSKYTNAQAVHANMVPASGITVPANYLAAVASTTGYGTATGNATQTLSTAFFTANIGSKVSLCLTHRSASTGTPRVYTIVGETGNTTSTTTANHAPYLTITYTAPSACSGTPTAGAAAASQHAASTTGGVTLSLTGASATANLTYAWQSSTTSAVAGFSAISGATNRTYSFTGVSAKTYFRCVVTCGGSSATSSVDSVSAIAASSCTPVYYYTYNSNSGTSLINCPYSFGPLVINGALSTVLRDSSFATATGYTDYTSNRYLQELTLYKTNTYNFTFRGSVNAVAVQMWIDYNNNGTFETTESIGGGTLAASTTTNFTTSAISASAAEGYYRMRVVSGSTTYQTYPFNFPCPNNLTGANFYYGETRDYLVKISNPPPAASASPASLAFNPPVITTGATSAAKYTLLSGTYLLPVSGSVTVTAPTNFSVCSTAAGTYVSSYTITYTSATLSATSVFVKFSPSAATAYSQSVTITGGGLAAAYNIPVTGTGAAACSATPSAGTSSASPTSGTAATSFTLSLSGVTTAGGLTYQWQSSLNNSTWANVSGATDPVYTFTGLATSTYYRCVVGCPTASTANSTSTLVSYTLSSPSCTPNTSTGPTSASSACTTFSMSFCGASIVGGVTIPHAVGTLTDNVACNSTGYRDRTALTAVMYKGFSYNAGVTFGGGSSSYSNFSTWWIDFNSNNTFEATEIVGYNSSAFTSGTVTLTIPAGAAVGTYRMRAVCDYNSSGHSGTSMDACMTSYTYGECRDYSVYIMNPPPAAAASPTAINFGVIGSSTTSSASTTSLTGAYLLPATGSFTLTAPTNYQISSNGTTWVSSYSVTYGSSTLGATTVYARFIAPASTGVYNDSISVTGGGMASTYYIRLNASSAPACSGMPTAGTAVSTPSSGFSSTVFTLSLSGTTLATGLQYQWFQSTSGSAGTWSSVSGATSNTYNVSGLSSTTYYYCQVSCPAVGLYDISSVKAISIYCQPTWYYNGCGSSYVCATASNHLKLNGASGSIDDATVCSATTTPSYLDQSATMGCTLNAGSSYTMTTGNTGTNMSYQVWIDFNSNGTFETTESVGGAGYATGAVRTFTLAIPAGSAAIAPGTYRMRVEGEYYYTSSCASYPSLASCPNANTSLGQYYGEIRDYTEC
jgi:hypothetical protein